MKKPRPDRLTRELAKSDTDATQNTKLPVPSPNPATNLVIASIVLRGASSLVRQSFEDRIARASASDDEHAQELLDGRTMITTLALYGASKLATRSPVGLGLVAGSLVLKTLYDRGKARQKRLRTKETGEG